MFCPHCGSDQLRTKNTRPTKQFTRIWRRRECEDCKNTFTTYEALDLSYLKVKKRSGKIQRYSRAKLFAGIYHATIDTRLSDRGQMGTKVESWTQEVEKNLMSKKIKILSSEEILNSVFRILIKHSPDTFLRFLAYKEGSDKKKIKEYLKKYLFQC